MSYPFGLSEDEFQRYFDLGLIKIAILDGPPAQEDSKRIQCQFGNRVWSAAIDPNGLVVWDDFHFLRGKHANRSR